MRLPELLAPAGSRDALVAAIAAGADAVYLSGKRFGARKYAANFDQEELQRAVDYAHIRGVRVYVTVNTLVRDRELDDVGRYLIWLYEIGADAVLLQDVGVASLARDLVPGLSLHASTQMTIHNSEGARWAKGLGMKRAVLAREVSLKEIDEISKAAGKGLGLEVFIHGALCYCYSGQCLLSSVIGGRSGNRGMCAQPCRKPYVLLRGEKDGYSRPVSLAAAKTKERFLISTRDLCTYQHLDRIIRSPVESLKIEGRMKSAEYVAIVVSIYRNALDAISEGSWKPSEGDVRDLALAFNRDFTSGHMLESKGFMGREMSDKRGVSIGTVTSYDSRSGEAAIRTSGPLPERGAGLVFLYQGTEQGMVIHRPPIFREGLLRLKTPDAVRPGTEVRMTSSSDLARRAEKIISCSKEPVPIDLKVYWEGHVPVISGRFTGPRGKIEVLVRAGFEMEDAKSRPLIPEQIESQIRRTGGTQFTVRGLEMDYPGGLFAPASALNQLRRDLLAEAEAKLLKSYVPDSSEIKRASQKLSALNLKSRASGQIDRKRPRIAVYADSLEAVRGAAEANCQKIYFEPALHAGCSQIKKSKGYYQELFDALARSREIFRGELAWKWPKITRNDYLASAVPLLARAWKENILDGVMVEGEGAAEAAKSAPGIPVLGAAGLNVWNHLAVCSLARDFSCLTLSPELSSDQMADLISRSSAMPRPDIEILVQGNQEVAVTEDRLPCAAFKDYSREKFYGLQDFKRVFPIYLDDDSRTHISNAAETCLVDCMPRISDLGLEGIAIDARGKTKRYAREMTQIYSRALEITERGGDQTSGELNCLKEEARRISLGGITYGHFLKGLKDELPDIG